MKDILLIFKKGRFLLFYLPISLIIIIKLISCHNDIINFICLHKIFFIHLLIGFIVIYIIYSIYSIIDIHDENKPIFFKITFNSKTFLPKIFIRDYEDFNLKEKIYFWTNIISIIGNILITLYWVCLVLYCYFCKYLKYLDTNYSIK